MAKLEIKRVTFLLNSDLVDGLEDLKNFMSYKHDIKYNTSDIIRLLILERLLKYKII